MARSARHLGSRYRRSLPWVLYGLLFVSSAALTGCRSETQGNAGETATAQSGKISPEEILQQMVKAYEGASMYADSGELHVRTVQDGNPEEYPPIPFSVTLQRPNRLRLHAFGTSVVSDGRELRASINELPDQILALTAPTELKLDDLYADEILASSLRGGMGLSMPQLQLLLANDPFKPFGGSAKAERLSDSTLDDDVCQRVKVASAAGETIYWVDAATHLLRKIEFPTNELKKNSGLARLDVWAEFTGARLDRKIPEDAFRFEVPPQVRLVRSFVQPPSEAPNPVLGQQFTDLAFVDLEGQPVTGEKLRGKIVVLDLWATWCHWCFEGLPNLQKVHQQYRDNDRVLILAVNTDTADIGNQQVQASFTKANISLPIVRDTNNYARDLFKVDGLPTMLILGPDGTVEDYEIGYKADLAETLPKKLDKLLGGESLAKVVLDKYQQELQSYHERLTEVGVATVDTFPLPKVDIAPRSEPAKLKLKRLWTADQVKTPGNLLAIKRGSGEVSLAVLDGPNTVAEVDAAGQVTARHELPIAPQTAVTYLRTVVDSSGKRFYAAFASTAQQLYLFDENWKLLVSYPDSEHPGIADVQFADLNGDGQPEVNVAYFGPVGVQNVSVEGKRLWSDRTLENALHLAAVPADQGQQQLLCINGRNSLLPINSMGKAGSPIQVSSNSLFSIEAADLDGDDAVELCALSASDVGVYTALGLDLNGRVLWSYSLPTGVAERPVEPLSTGPLLTDSQAVWVLTAADGSIHIVSRDGQLIDKFNYGAMLTGIGAANFGGRPVLIVSSIEGLTAWEITSAE